ncbi:Zinc finger A20 and AN1 domain-containing stress-associated protein 4 [Capsicum baccatum]|uniref:Zinc finger A20 and AN1 domain-containing stress-associated protein 4 n=1 Tax=Capsicum baccatum TaxID=33114 RepID=A0A2G2V8Y7_CAPBA|nr:Zinc finger A20 and AN1 domain-containing stress-associated protein 4 [Capsicum baccatum]
MGRSQLICTGGSLMVTVQYSNDYKDDKNEALHTQYIFCTDVPHMGPAFHAAGIEMESSKETGCRAPENPIHCINDCDFFGSVATMNMCSNCQKDMILLKQEYAKLVAVSSKDNVCRSSTCDESELALAGAAVASCRFSLSDFTS